MKVKWLMLVCLLTATLMALSCAPTKAPPKAEVPAGYKSIRMVGAALGGNNTTTVIALACVFNKYYPEIEWSSCSGAAATNPIYITQGTIKLATGSPGAYVNAYGFGKIPESRLRSLNLPTPLTHQVFLIPENKPWKDITQVPKGLTLCPGSPGATGPVLCEAWLNLFGLSRKDFNWGALGKPEAADAWRSGKLDFYFGGLTGPEAFIMDLYNSPRGCKLMGLSTEQAAKAKSQRTFEPLGCTAPTMSNLSEVVPEVFKYDVLCPQQPFFLSCRDDFPGDIAYRIAKTIDEHNAELAQMYPALKYATPQWHMKWAEPPFDIHPGVAKYYREKGYLK